MICSCGKIISRYMKGKCMACRYEEKMKYRPKPKHEQICPVCGRTFWLTTANKQIYCSKICGQKARGRIANPLTAVEVSTICRCCGKTFTYKRCGRGSAKPRVYCSNQCSGRYNRQKKLEKLQGKAYVPLTPEQIAKLPASPPGEIRTIPIESLQVVTERKPAPSAKIRIPISKLPYRGEPTRDHSNDPQVLRYAHTAEEWKRIYGAMTDGNMQRMPQEETMF